MKTCPICEQRIPNRVVVNGKVVNTQRRKYCYDCSPVGSGNNKQLKHDSIASESRQRKIRKSKEQYTKSQKKLRLGRKKLLVEMLGGKCSKCGYDRCLRALEFHHREASDKEFSLSALGYTCRWERLVEEVKKCQLLCSNCHRESEAEIDEMLDVVI